MYKTRKHFKETIELCRNCGGRGLVSEPKYRENSISQQTVLCPVCAGHGRIWKVIESTVRIGPFRTFHVEHKKEKED